ncbi:MAG: hypothetical protein H7Y36_07415 [Armatimonadetes bacterium]|nr:hypothetical protein [Akkermansiaceae bacterium]
MKRNRRQENPQGLEPLARQAQDYALHMMRTTGSVPPTVIADTDEGFVFCMPTALTDDAAKDRFAEVTRLFAIGQSARSIVMIAEAWARHPDARGHLDTETPPSQAPDRKEVVVLMLEDHSRNATRMLPILRDDADVFSGFGDPGPLQFGESQGRFSGLMPRNKPSVREAAQARTTLISLGMNIINRGFDPTMN